MREGVTIRHMMPSDLLVIARQPSQRVQLGLVDDVAPEQALAIADLPHSHAALDGDRVAAVFGVTETYPGRQGVAWAIFASGLSRVHLPISRFCRDYIAGVGLARIEAVTVVAPGAQTFDQAMSVPTPELRWAMLLGLQPAHLLRNFGAASETMMLCERIS